MRYLIRYFAIAFLFLAPGFASWPSMAQSGEIVREIVVEGSQRIEPATVRSYLLIQEGDVFNPGRIDRSLKSLFATGLFADVSLRRQGDTLIVYVVENPVINRIAFEGNERLDDEILDSEVSLRPRVIYTRTKVQNDVKRILTLYRRNGRFAATVDPKVIQLPQNRVDLVFEINEGKLTEVRKIRFVGNREYSDSRLRDVIRTRETRWYRFFTSDDTYDPDRLTLDREMLRQYYLTNGFADFRVVSGVAELTPDRKDFFITFTIEEGNRYRFGTIDVEARLRDLKKEDLLGAIGIEEGEWYDVDEMENVIDELTNVVGTLGYAFVEVRPRIDRDRQNRTINITFEVNEGPRVFVERIDISGNVRSADKVIRREFRLVEGDAFNTSKLRRSKQRIQNLDFFDMVNVEQLPGSAPDKTVIKVDVEEKSTGSLSIGAGFSTTSGALADFGIRERNFMGRGQNLSINLVIAERKTEIDFSFTEPYFLDREVSAGFDIFRWSTNLQDYSSYDTESLGGALRTGYFITENLNQGWKYTLKQTDVTEVATGASPLIKAAKGKTLLSEISHSILYDRRDSRIMPTEGYFLGMTNDVAGLGGDKRYLRNRFNGGKFFRFADQWVLSLTGSVGYIVGIGKGVSLTERFFIGGDDLRGFATHGVGPRDQVTKDALGGEWMYVGTAELSFPLGLPDELGINGKVFTDFGSAGKLSQSSVLVQDTGSLRASIGTGINWISPFGPIGIDFGIPVIKEDFDVDENFRINFGTRF